MTDRAAVGHLIEHERRVVWQCEVCRARGPVDLARVCAALGPDFSLANRRPSCRLCPGRVEFKDETSMYGHSLDTGRINSAAWFAYNAAERTRLYALGWRVEMGKWIAPSADQPAQGAQRLDRADDQAGHGPDGQDGIGQAVP